MNVQEQIDASIAKQLKNYSFLFLSFYFTSCTDQKKPETIHNALTEQASPPTKRTTAHNFREHEVTKMYKDIRSIFQDKNGDYWFGTNSAGVYRYNGKTLIQFTVEDGLSNNQVQSIQEDSDGNIWFGTGLFGVTKFDGQTFTTFTKKENLQLSNAWKIDPNDLWFYAGGGVYRIAVWNVLPHGVIVYQLWVFLAKLKEYSHKFLV